MSDRAHLARLAAKFGPKGTPAAGQHQLFGTTEGNAIVAPIHPKTMPVILTTPAEFDRWLEQDAPDALGVATAVARRCA